MKRFVEGEDRLQGILLPEFLDDYVAEDNLVRVIDVFVDELDLRALGFEGVDPEATGRPAYHPATLLKIYLYGYLNRIQSSRRLERETQRNIELMWLTPTAPDRDRRLPPRQRACDPRGLCAVHRAVPSVRPFHADCHCDRQEQAQGSQRSRQELHSGKGRRAH